MLLVKDVTTNKTVGEFSQFNEDLFTAVICDDEEEEDQIDTDTTAVLGHIDSKWKQLPVETAWHNDIEDEVELKLQGMVVVGC
ncbi:hypothetical protein BDB01DRAFT_717696 [Pilobolus umbonatus]|nr:hypothetical protein BDB01DRAFT_717696 [Pilobolus umbonatus]